MLKHSFLNLQQPNKINVILLGFVKHNFGFKRLEIHFGNVTFNFGIRIRKKTNSATYFTISM